MPIVVGETLGHYRVQAKIGEGGMGVVYRAEQIAVNRPVVIKVLTADLATDQGALDRFKREVDIIAQLEHPHILPLYDFGQVDNNPYIVMRYMAGGSLSDRLRSRSLTLEQRMRILEQTAEALDYAHERDIIHRDLKPANILLDERGNAYLADFGLAKTMEGSRDLTKSGSVLGTPAYMSPEQARGEKLDRRSDIYAFAVLTYEVLGGRLPFTGKSTWEYIQKHLVEPPPSILTIAPQLPPALDQVLGAGLAKDRELRPNRAVEFIQAVQTALAGAQVTLDGVSQPGYASTGISGARNTVSRPATTRAATPGVTQLASQPGRASASVAAAPAPAAPSAVWALPVMGAILGGGLILAAIVAVVIYFALQGGGASSPGPKVASYPVGKSPRALVFDLQAIWVVNTASDTIERLSATGCEEGAADPCGKALGTYPVGTLSTALAYDGHSVWVASTLDPILTQVEPASGKTLAQYPLKSVPSAMMFVGDSLWTADSISGAVTHIGLDGKILGQYAMGQHSIDNSTSLAFDGLYLWVANQDDGSLTVLNPANGQVRQTVKLDGQPMALASDGHRIWVALGDKDQVVAVNPADGSIGAPISVGKRPLALLYDGQTLWVANQQGNTVMSIDVANAKVLKTLVLAADGGPYALAWAPCGSGCGDLWVAGEKNNTVSRIRINP